MDHKREHRTPPLARVMGVGRQQQPICCDNNGTFCSGHCMLLNSYKKRLKQTDSSSCPDCGMDPQDVPHLLNSISHPTDFTHMNLWNNPVKTIRELSFLDRENLQ